MRRRQFLGATALAPVLQLDPSGGPGESSEAPDDPLVVDATVPPETAVTVRVAQHETIARENEVYAEAVDVRDGEHGYHVPLSPGYVTSIDVALETDDVTRSPTLHRLTVSLPGSGEGRDADWGVYGGIMAIVGGALLRSRVEDRRSRETDDRDEDGREDGPDASERDENRRDRR